MDKKITFSLFLMAFLLSTFLSIVGIIPVIGEYFNVSITMAWLFVGLFALILGVSGLVLPTHFSSFERKKFFILTLIIFILSSFLQIFIDNFYLALFIRLIPAFFYSSAISIALTIMSELSPKDVNKVILGVSTGTILGMSISTQIGLEYGYQVVNVWIFLINIVALVGICTLLPKMEGKRKNYFSQVHHAKTDKFAVSVLFILCIGIAISTVYNYISIILLDLTHVHENIISIFLFANGIASIVGTSLFGHLINKKHDIAILIYPTVFIGAILLLGIEIHLPAFVFILLIMFGMLDGSMHTIAQYWISSSVKEALEFANGVYLFVNNLNRAIGILLGGFLIDNGLIYYIFTASMCFFALATPWVLYRIRKYTPLGCRIDYGLRRFTPQVLLNLLLK